MRRIEISEALMSTPWHLCMRHMSTVLKPTTRYATNKDESDHRRRQTVTFAIRIVDTRRKNGVDNGGDLDDCETLDNGPRMNRYIEDYLAVRYPYGIRTDK